LAAVNLPSAIEGREYYAEIAAYGGEAPYVYSIVSGKLPPGLQLLVDTAPPSIAGVPAGNTSATPPPSGGPYTFRYLKVSTISNSWIAWREIEVYDSNGAKIPVATSRASNYYSAPEGEDTPDKAYDGYTNTLWNNSAGDFECIKSGQVTGSCHTDYGQYGQGPVGNWLHCTGPISTTCSSFRFNGWIVLDFGRPVTAYGVAMFTENSPSPADATHDVLMSSDGVNFTEIHQFSGGITNHTWLTIGETPHGATP